MLDSARCCFAILAVSFLLLGCQKLKREPTAHPKSDASAEPMLLRASSACLATIARLEEHDDRPVDGDHRIEAWLRVEESSGEIPEFLHLVIHYGGHMTIESLRELEAQRANVVLRHDSLTVGERHWFVFSEDYDSSKFPWRVAGWWRYVDGDVPHDVVEAVQNDRFADHPTWDKALNVVYLWQEIDGEIQIRVRDADDEVAVLFDKTLVGKMESVKLSHWAVSYEMEWPQKEDVHFVQVAIVGQLSAENEFELPAGSYRMMYAFELRTGKKAAVWVAKNQEIWLMHAFRQYDLDSGRPTIIMEFDLLTSGGIAAGGETENWYRRRVSKYDDGKLQSEEVFRHAHITTGAERIYSGSGWLPVKADLE